MTDLQTTDVKSLLSARAMQCLLHYASRVPPGAFVEIGVYQGGSAYYLDLLAKRQGRPLFLFDTFTGMPKAGPLDADNPVGKFADTSIELVRSLVPRATLVPGLFPGSLADVELPPVAFVHADADNYEVTRDILAEMPRRMVRGGFILFDDYGHPGCDGCTQAVNESTFPLLVIAETGKALVIV